MRSPLRSGYDETEVAAGLGGASMPLVGSRGRPRCCGRPWPSAVPNRDTTAAKDQRAGLVHHSGGGLEPLFTPPGVLFRAGMAQRSVCVRDPSVGSRPCAPRRTPRARPSEPRAIASLVSPRSFEADAFSQAKGSHRAQFRSAVVLPVGNPLVASGASLWRSRLSGRSATPVQLPEPLLVRSLLWRTGRLIQSCTDAAQTAIL